MKHLKKTWQVIAYAAVLFVLVILDLELIGQFFIAAGFAWLVIHLMRNNGPRKQRYDFSGVDEFGSRERGERTHHDFLIWGRHI
ncbi:hypothetical protein AB838_03270 [Rhodobacteraceae bacterium (ex Bugula neritina AB1)]|nr:hypothetical protein AB838_03270 [Rhodobacteraceae bacterium (ex Bugula neritina AB1)]